MTGFIAVQYVGGHPEYLHVVKLTHLIPESTVTIVPQIQEWSLVMEASGDQAGVVHPQGGRSWSQ